MTGSLQVKKGFLYIVLNLKDDNGKRKLKWIPTGLKEKGNRRKAEQLLRNTIVEYEQSKINLTDSILFTDFLSEWLQIMKINKAVRENTLHQYELLVNNSIVPFFKPMGLKLTDITPVHIQKYYTHLQTRESNSKKQAIGVSASTVKHHHANISKALNHAVKMNLIAYNPASRIELPRLDKKVSTDSFYTDEQILILLDALKGNPLYTATFLCAHLGLRRSEVLGLKWDAIHIKDNDDSYLVIKRTLIQVKDEVKCKDTVKTSTSHRTLYISDAVKSFLLDLKRHQAENKLLLGQGYQDDNFSCTWDDGRVLRPGYITEMFPKAIKKLNIPALPVKNFHSLRHSAASMIINNSDGDISMKELSEFLGHSSITITIDLYSHLQFKGKKKVGKLIANSLTVAG